MKDKIEEFGEQKRSIEEKVETLNEKIRRLIFSLKGKPNLDRLANQMGGKIVNFEVKFVYLLLFSHEMVVRHLEEHRLFRIEY